MDCSSLFRAFLSNYRLGFLDTNFLQRPHGSLNTFTTKIQTQYSFDLTAPLFLLHFWLLLLTGYHHCITFVMSDFE